VTAPLDTSVSGSEIRDALRRAGLTQGAIARATGLSPTTVSRVCAGAYDADGDARAAVFEAINFGLKSRGEALLLDVSPASTTTPTPTLPLAGGGQGGGRGPAPILNLAAARLPDVVPGMMSPWGGAFCTAGQRVLWAMLKATAEDRELCLLAAQSGCGKTYLIERFRERYPETLVFRPLRGISQSGILEDLCRLFGVPYSGANDSRRRRLLEAAKGRSLVVDEADLLVAGRYARQAVDRLEIYRQLQERGCAVALVGLPALIQTVVTGGETYVFSRIGYAGIGQPPTPEELAAYWRAQMAGYPQAVAKAGQVALSAARHGHLRYLDKLAKRTRVLDGDVAGAESFLFRGEPQ
jgi:DNA transposition AAA+ family ATPase